MLFDMILKNQEGSTFDYALIVKARDRSRTDNLIITNDSFVFLAIFYKWLKVCLLWLQYFTIKQVTMQINSLSIPVDSCLFRWSWLRFDYNLTTVGENEKG